MVVNSQVETVADVRSELREVPPRKSAKESIYMCPTRTRIVAETGSELAELEKG